MPGEVDGAVVLLGDMPQVRASLIDRLIGAFDPERGALVVVPTIDGKRGNPVVWSRRFFPELMALEGDVGARHLIGKYGEAVVEVPVAGQAALIDVDTPDALAAVKAELEKRGYKVVPGTGAFGGYEAIMFDPVQHVYWRATEFRKDGEVIAGAASVAPTGEPVRLVQDGRTPILVPQAGVDPAKLAA